MHLVRFRFYLLRSKLKTIGYCLWGKQHHNAIHSSRNLKITCCILLGIHARSPRVFVYHYEDSIEDYEGMTAQKLSDHSDKKRTQEFLPGIQAMIENNPSKSIGSIARNMGMSEFLIRQIVHEDIWYSSYKKVTIFIRDHEKQEKRMHCKALEQTQACPPSEYTLVFLRWEKFLPGSDHELTEQLLAFSVLTRCTNINEIQTPSPHHGVWEGH